MLVTLRSGVTRKCANLFVQGRGADRSCQGAFVNSFEKGGNGFRIGHFLTTRDGLDAIPSKDRPVLDRIGSCASAD